MKLSSHSVVALRAVPAAALVLLLGAALPLAAQTAIGGVETIRPTVPTGLVATAVSATQIGSSWNPSTDNVGATGYRVYWGTASGVYLQARGAGLSTTTTTYTVTGLASPARYFFAVTAQNTLEESVYSNEIFVDVGISLESPSGKMLTQAGVDSIVDSVGEVWTLGPPLAPDSPLFRSYLLARGAGLSTTSTTCTVTGLASPARYFFAVTAHNTLEESVYSNEIFVDVGISLESPSGKMLTQAGVDSI